MSGERSTKAAGPCSLGDFTAPGLIVPALRCRDRAGAIDELCARLQKERRVPPGPEFADAVNRRESLASTDLKNGLAIPHARSIKLRQLSFAFGRCAEPLVWEQPPADVCFVFLLAVPETAATAYLLLIAQLACLAQDPAFVKKLRAARAAADILKILRATPVRDTTGALAEHRHAPALAMW